MEECVQAEPLIPIVQNRAIDHSEMEKRLDQAASEQPNKRRTGGDEPALPCIEGRMERRVLRSQYRASRTIINVQTPREHRIDAETFFEIAKTLSTKVQSYCKSGVSPCEFIASLIHEFGRRTTKVKNRVSIKWKEIGMLVSPIFNEGHGCFTMYVSYLCPIGLDTARVLLYSVIATSTALVMMLNKFDECRIGPMNAELKQRRLAAQRKHWRSNKITVRPEEPGDTGDDAKTDTDKNIVTMFNIMRKEKSVRLENLVLNRFLFAQTVENLFTLWLLVKDGRAKIAVDDKGLHPPMNAPSSHLVKSGEVAYSHFVFRIDFEDWKLMVETVGGGEELMPHRYQVSMPISKTDQLSAVLPVAIPTSAMGIVSKDE
ncbi:hypothetical protein Cgig2_000459 [Carnegiea gigantea]|uniref:Non-structural maintenance of chromosomes element 4 n=1 Tax=Carnegiea gigantea TaxID=171969 RepID=A0A9Q1K443_9CARY|nr:hypothetical protein Cgig2_000459 [Carnegiea gigantea]